MSNYYGNGVSNSGGGNLTIGAQAGSGVPGSSYDNCTLVGSFAGASLTSGDDNTYIGNDAGQYNATGRSNACVGSSAGKGGDGAIMASYNDSVCMGYNAGRSMLTSAGNVYIGFQAGQADTDQVSNTAVGGSSMLAAAGGVGQNTSVGYASMRFLSTGNNNTAIGAFAGASSPGTNTYTRCVLAGYFAGRNLTTGPNNTLLGYNAGWAATTSDTLTLVGYNNNCAATGVSRSCAIGTAHVVNHSDCIVLGSAITTAASSTVYLGSTANPLTVGTSSPSAGAAGALPATPAGYLTVYINSTARQIPYY